MTITKSADYSGRELLHASGMNRFLGELNIAIAPVSPAQFSGRLAELIDLSHSVKISLAHSGMHDMEFEPFDNSVDVARTEFMRVHSEVIELLVQSFSPGSGGSRLKTPLPKTLGNDNKKAALKPYINFYLYYQRMLESKVSRLRDYIRDSAYGLSIKLAQLAKLDEVLADTLAAHDRKTFAKVPQQLERRFMERLQPALAEQLPELHASFCSDMQALLLAELEVRLLPVLGLIETIESANATTGHTANTTENLII